ncbi:MAG: acyl CoA:acetate/3-ketoacid CoA transferase [Gammaproteobacteria bacterium]|nr:acyl CoA:acetate/3-ketoacid CoA transferase [Gammaproteobacteria bacterium]MBU1440205.1 acyl CoA:acetate/3-ketoacid CoA transferase [Gammaproteobacteria bacterium]MBU2409977.1 acyl CoA:acetate/3-ketoacid CoA transferase [Gammaproteobacteria bacterium]
MAVRVIDAAAAAEMVGDGATVIVGGVVSMVTPEIVLRALGQRFEQQGHPRALTLICPNRTGWIDADSPHGFEHFAHAGMVSHLITSTFSAQASPRFTQLVMDGSIDASVVPMGVLFKWLRECTARSPGLLTEVGMGTYFEPDGHAQQSGPAGSSAGGVVARSGRVAKRVCVDGIDCIFMPSIPIDVALIRGSIADTDGNISLDDEPVNGGALQMAMAARNSGGRVIAVVKALTAAGSLHPRRVQVPGMVVDAVVVDPGARQSLDAHEPAFTGELRRPHVPLPAMEMGLPKLILRRAAMELHRGDLVNLGYGMGTQLPALAREEGFLDALRFSVEHGAIGGIPCMKGAFGAHYNPSSIIDPTDLFDFYQGGGLDATILGFAQVDAAGNVNVGGAYTGSLRGPGGFVDIAHRTPLVLICGTLTSGGLEARLDGGVQIVREGRHRKFPRATAHVDLCGARAAARGQRVLVVTERCVFEVRAEGLTLIEIAPGIDVARDIAPCLDFELRTVPEPAVMPAAMYGRGPVGLLLQSTPRARRERTGS